MKAIWNGAVLAEAPKEDLIRIEGNWYFPPSSIHKEFFTPSDMHTECIWKGTASYYDVAVKNETNEAAAWYYPVPKDGSIKRVSRDFKDYVAFWRGVEVRE
jgi:uncharacterized protein (DUF427 family)